jgi:glyoxylase-like metal-dependent hydrolase (beta-lactamase superfamily II)
MGAPKEMLETIVEHRTHFGSWGTGYSVDRRFDHDDEVFGFRARHVPGHSASDTIFQHEADRFAFVGDHFIRRMHPVPLLRAPRPDGTRGHSLVEYRQSVPIARAMDVEICYPGHGEAIDDHKALLDRYAAGQDRRADRIHSLLAAHPGTPHDLLRILHPKATPETYFMTLSNVVSFLEWLEDDGRARSELRGGIRHYQAT